MITISESTRGAAWLQAVKTLREHNGLIYNLIIEILEPSAKSSVNLAAQRMNDLLLIEADEIPVCSVAETIFPAWEFRRYGTEGVYSVYPEQIYPEIKKLQANRWGTYAHRLVRRRDENNKCYNPLERVVNKLRSELERNNPKRAAYELDTEAHGLSTYNAETDWNNYLGGQCLSHISLKLGPDHELYLTAMYRYQFFIRKALGNFLGLARLQAFIAQEVGIPIGPLVCHATLAQLDPGKTGGWGLRDIDTLTRELSHIVMEVES